MGAFVGELKTYDWFKWACEAKLCEPTDEVRRMILDIGIDDVVRVYIEKYADEAYLDVRLPAIRNIKKVELDLPSTTRVVGVRDGALVKELTPYGRELQDAKAEVTRLTNELVELAASHGVVGDTGGVVGDTGGVVGDTGGVVADIVQPPDAVRGDDKE